MKTRILMSVAAAALLACSAVASAQGTKTKDKQDATPAPMAQKAAPAEKASAPKAKKRHVRRHYAYRHYYRGPYYGPYYGYYGSPAPFPFFPFAPWMW